jgi:type III secretory pathway component EscS
MRNDHESEDFFAVLLVLAGPALAVCAVIGLIAVLL